MDTASTLLGPIMARNEPLRRLTDWRLPRANSSTIRCTSRSSNTSRRKLKKLRRRHQEYNSDSRIHFYIAEYMPPNTLEIVLEDCVKVNGLSPSNGLRQHPDLEVFRMSEHVECRFGVHLGQIWREREWAVVKLQELQLVFAMGPSRREPDPSTLVNDLNPSKTSTPLLDSLYYRIAKPATTTDSVLEDLDGGKLFSRLDQLEELHGSFNVDKVQHGFEFGEREADWIVEHWPKLKFIELYTVREGRVVEYSPGVRYLMERMPKLKVVKTFKGRYLPGYPKEAIPSTSQQANGTE
ncbi:hypothetical protein BGZ90_010771 [Linnemannia elongata]|nr:hypothetical protein BGZ90_010771 [Linnemannia elongata]